MKKTLTIAALLVSCAAWADPIVLKVGSLAPRESPWGQVMRTYVKAVKEKTKGEVIIEIFWNGTQGDEPVMVSKMKTGQLDGAVVTGVGLGTVDVNVNVLQLPGLYGGWAKLDKVRDALKPTFQKSFAAAGMEIIGWGDIGLDHFMSKGFAIRKPDDFKGKRPWMWREDPIWPPFYQKISVVPVASSLPEVLPALSTGEVDSLGIAALAAEQVQWTSRLDTINTMVLAPNIGAVIATKAALDKLKPEHRAIVIDLGRIACQALTERIRHEDDLAFERVKQRMTVVTPTAEEQALWDAAFKDMRARLAKGTLSAELISQAEKLAQ